MMMNNVVKSSQLAAIFSEFNAIIHSDITNRLCRKRTQDFSASIYLGPVKLRISQDMNLDFQ